MAKKDEELTVESMREMLQKSFRELNKTIDKTVFLRTSRLEKKLDQIDRHTLELKAEIRSLRELFTFWAERHKSPDLIEKFLQAQKIKKSKTKLEEAN